MSESADAGPQGTLTRATWRNRIVGSGVRPARDFNPNPLNWRTHPAVQQAALSGIMADVGWVQQVVVNKTTGNLLDGHLRVEMALDRNEDVPFVEVEVTESEEHLILATLDPIGALAEVDAARQRQLLDLIDAPGDLQDLIDSMAGSQADVAAPERIVGPSLVDRFVVPPFSILDSRQGYWQDRKRQWLSLGIKSELGRGENLTYQDDSVRDIDFYHNKRACEAVIGREISKQAFARFDPAERALFNGKPSRDLVARAKQYASEPDVGRQESGWAFQSKPGPARAFGEDLMRGESSTSRARQGKPKAKRLLFSDSKALHEAWDNQDPGTRSNSRRDADKRSNLTGAPPMPEYSDIGMENMAPGTSIFDPVLCEVAYRWFTPKGGTVLDPFAGGSVRGVAAAILGRHYVGIDLSADQLEANREQAAAILAAAPAPSERTIADPEAATPIERHGDVWVKRDDLFAFGGVRGGKVRTCLAIARTAQDGLITAGSRQSPQVQIVSAVARELGLPCRVHVPSGATSAEVKSAADAGAEVVKHKPGYNTVIVARAKSDAAESGWTEVPFGMECAEAVKQNRGQVRDIPEGVRRIVVPVGSGMSLAGILHGLDDIGRSDIPVVGVMVGADPTDRLNEYAPSDWHKRVEMRGSGSDYTKAARETVFWGIDLDPHYEAKAAPHVEPGDLFWVVGRRSEAAPAATDYMPTWLAGDSNVVLDGDDVPAEVDFVFTCPPYFDLEVYSDDPADLSAMTIDDFDATYRSILRKAARRLRPDRFAAVVISDVRDKRGDYRGLPQMTVEAFEAEGCTLYNEGVFINAAGSLPMRAARQFSGGRKLGRTHQEMLVFLKGDWRAATEACGMVEVDDSHFGEMEADEDDDG